MAQDEGLIVIIRTFRARIARETRAEFDDNFADLSVRVVQSASVGGMSGEEMAGLVGFRRAQ